MFYALHKTHALVYECNSPFFKKLLKKGIEKEYQRRTAQEKLRHPPDFIIVTRSLRVASF
jgi:hypothetical protein